MTLSHDYEKINYIFVANIWNNDRLRQILSANSKLNLTNSHLPTYNEPSFSIILEVLSQ